MADQDRAATTRWWHGQMTLCWHPESPGVTIYVWRPWWRKRRPFASLSEVLRYYRPDFDARVDSGSSAPPEAHHEPGTP